MKKISLKVNFKDKRGIIVDLLSKKNINAITYLTIKKGFVRGNHFHKKTKQWNYIISGKMRLIGQFSNKVKKYKILKKGDLFLSEVMEKHALVGVTNVELLVFTQGPRGGKEFENDTFRLPDDKKLI
jgi:hypothetical protein